MSTSALPIATYKRLQKRYVSTSLPIDAHAYICSADSYPYTLSEKNAYLSADSCSAVDSYHTPSDDSYVHHFQKRNFQKIYAYVSCSADSCYLRLVKSFIHFQNIYAYVCSADSYLHLEKGSNPFKRFMPTSALPIAI